MRVELVLLHVNWLQYVCELVAVYFGLIVMHVDLLMDVELVTDAF